MSGEKKALIVAVSKYDKLQQLDFCENDGKGIYDVLRLPNLGFEIAQSNYLTGEVKFSAINRAISNFFTDEETSADDTLLFYFTGHGIPEATGSDHYLAASDIDPRKPFNNGFQFDELTKMMGTRCNSKRVIAILSCCYSGALRIDDDTIGMGDESANAQKVREAMESSIDSRIRQGEGKCVLAASLSSQEAFGSNTAGHSIFTHYILEGLKGANGASVDTDGSVTPQTLGDYVYYQMIELVRKNKLNQKPIVKGATLGRITIANYPGLSKISKPPDKVEFFNKGYEFLKKREFSNALGCFERSIEIDKSYMDAWHGKAFALLCMKKYDEAVSSFDKALEIDANDEVAMKGKNFALDALWFMVNV